MIEIVINWDESKNQYKLYESSTKTLLLSPNLTEGLLSLNNFLTLSNLISSGNILEESGIVYHLDSFAMKSIVESNVKLLKQLKSGPSSFAVSTSKFGTTASSQTSTAYLPGNKFTNSEKGFGSNFGRSSSFGRKSNFGKSYVKMNGGYDKNKDKK